MNLENLTEKEIKALRRVGWLYTDIIQEIVYNNDVHALMCDDSEGHNAYFATIDLCRACSAELEKRGIEE